MRIFIDTEFWERGPDHPIQLISIGMITEDGNQFYAENSAFDRKNTSDWLAKNVVPHLLSQVNPCVMSVSQIKKHLITWVGTFGGSKPEFWGYFADYDWVVFCQIFGTMMNLPTSFPRYCMDLKQLMKFLGVSKEALPKQEGIEHNSLNDARWNKEVFGFLMEKIKSQSFVSLTATEIGPNERSSED